MRRSIYAIVAATAAGIITLAAIPLFAQTGTVAAKARAHSATGAPIARGCDG
jgi:hypothetical protein